MHIIRHDDTTPPQLLLGLSALQAATVDESGSPPAPIVISAGSTHLVNTRELSKLTGEAVTTAKVASTIALVGQMLWRYVPLLLEADSRKANSVMQTRRMSSILSDSSDFHTLRTLPNYTQLIRDALNLRRRAEHQAASEAYGDQTTLCHDDFRVIGDYAKFWHDARFFPTQKSDLTLPMKAYLADSHYKIQQNVRRGLALGQRYMDNKWPFIHRKAAIRADFRKYRSRNFDDANLQPRISGLSLNTLTNLKGAQPIRLKHDCSDHNAFLSVGKLREGTFYSTPLFNATLTPMSDDDFGQVDLSSQPFEIQLNSRMLYPRVKMSMVHEMMHILDDMHKLNLSHETVHELALMIVNDVLPGLSALAEHTNNALV